MSDIATPGVSLAAWLERAATPELSRVVMAIAEAAQTLEAVIRRGPLAGALGALTGGESNDGDGQKALDMIANETFIAALRGAGVKGVVSEENDLPLPLNPQGTLVAALDPLDGSSNIDTNSAIGTIFSVYPAQGPDAARIETYLAPGTLQQAAGFVIYGPHCALVFSLGEGTHIATLDPHSRMFMMTRQNVLVKEGAAEFAINASNRRHWHRPVQAYIDDCLDGQDGPRERNFNMRWVASMVADAYRILMRGGVYLYPGDKRQGYERGRLRHLYEANPIALVMEQAGGMATDGLRRMLDIAPKGLHERIPLVFGSSDKVIRIRRYMLEDNGEDSASPLFGQRGLLRR